QRRLRLRAARQDRSVPGLPGRGRPARLRPPGVDAARFRPQRAARPAAFPGPGGGGGEPVKAVAESPRPAPAVVPRWRALAVAKWPAVAWAVAFAVAHTQAPLFFSN